MILLGCDFAMNMETARSSKMLESYSNTTLSQPEYLDFKANTDYL